MLSSLRLPSVPALALYVATLVIELPVIYTRMLLTFAVAALVLLVNGGSTAGASELMKLAMIPTAWSLLALITPRGGGWWWRANLGGREPSARERAAYEDALALLQAPGRLPARWFVIDTPLPDAAVCGETLMLSRGLLENEHLPAVLAHELAHINSSDGKLTAALNRVVVHPPPRTTPRQPHPRAAVTGSEELMLGITLAGALAWLLRRLLAFAKGGLALRLLAPFWSSYWREREHAADRYAARLGQGEDLADFLELHALIHDHPIPFIWLGEHSHPPAELRIERLRKATAGWDTTSATCRAATGRSTGW
jgi:Zn-dependent protease with chaperone function